MPTSVPVRRSGHSAKFCEHVSSTIVSQGAYKWEVDNERVEKRLPSRSIPQRARVAVLVALDDVFEWTAVTCALQRIGAEERSRLSAAWSGLAPILWKWRECDERTASREGLGPRASSRVRRIRRWCIGRYRRLWEQLAVDEDELRIVVSYDVGFGT